MERTVEEFVEDLISDNRTASEILVITRVTRWATRIEEVKEILKNFQKILKKVR